MLKKRTMDEIAMECQKTIESLTNRVLESLEPRSKIEDLKMMGLREQLEKAEAAKPITAKDVDEIRKALATSGDELKLAKRYYKLEVPVNDRLTTAADKDAKQITANDHVKFSPRSQGVAKKCKRLNVGEIYKVDETNYNSIKITTGHLQHDWYKAAHFEVQERPLSTFMQELQSL